MEVEKWAAVHRSDRLIVSTDCIGTQITNMDSRYSVVRKDRRGFFFVNVITGDNSGREKMLFWG